MSSTTGSAVITTPTDTQIVISRQFAAPRELVWDAFTKPEHVRNWWGPRKYENHITEIDLRPGGSYRFGQRGPDGMEVLFGGTYREIEPPRRAVYTERWLNMPAELGGGAEGSPEAVITATFDEYGGRTTVTLVCEYGSREVRDAVLASGMESGMQESYDRIDEILATAQ
ncbi:SRPBCC family protein [Thermocrispum municipale]|jgi:uncharacterized protein YndB with AHSA1/START domain|uniref:SRPBCC family protein n=1 Tax=Thermocrispum municipale TaxID=37926 RepID=UPI000417FFC8|nr:SRPBCC family protein [Thermocrispum municipale]